MATTSPDNLRTPDPGDPYNLVPDLATLSGDVQTALNKRSVTSGTEAQRTAFTSSATDGWLWQDTDGIKMIWRKDGASWVPTVWRWSGTTAQMNAFTAPNGFEWFNTTDNNEYVRLSGAWGASKIPMLSSSYASAYVIPHAANTWANHPAPAVVLSLAAPGIALIEYNAYVAGNGTDYGMIAAAVSGATTVGAGAPNAGSADSFGPHTAFGAMLGGGHVYGRKIVNLNAGSNTIQLQSLRSAAVPATASYTGMTVRIA